MPFSPLPQSKRDLWFCLHHGTHTYRSGGVLIHSTEKLFQFTHNQSTEAITTFLPPLLLLSLEDTCLQRELIQSHLSSKGGHRSCLHCRAQSAAVAFSYLTYTYARTEKPSPHGARHWSLIISIATTVFGTHREQAARTQLVHFGSKEGLVQTWSQG